MLFWWLLYKNLLRPVTIVIWAGSLAVPAIGQSAASSTFLCTESFEENGVQVFVSAYSYNPMDQLNSGTLLSDPLAPRSVAVSTSLTFPVVDERFGTVGLENSERRELVLFAANGFFAGPLAVNVFFRNIGAATGEALQSRNLECRFALDGVISPDFPELDVEQDTVDGSWSARCRVDDPDAKLGLVDIGIIDKDTGEPAYRGRFGSQVPPETMQKIGDAIRQTGENARAGLCDF